MTYQPLVITQPKTNGSQPATAFTPPVVVVRLENVNKTYEEAGQQHSILHAVCFDFYAGQFTALLGKSGSGKSTLLNLISGIDDVTAGTVWIADRPVNRLPERERTLFRRNHVGFVFQFFNLIPTLTVKENVLLPLELTGTPARTAQTRVDELLQRVGLADRQQAFPDRLSGGEQQRVAIARALAADPSLILADEPTGNLDEDTGRQVLALLLELTRQAGKTLIMATHSMEVAGHADRVLRITHGGLVETPELSRAGRATTRPPATGSMQ